MVRSLRCCKHLGGRFLSLRNGIYPHVFRVSRVIAVCKAIRFYKPPLPPERLRANVPICPCGAGVNIPGGVQLCGSTGPPGKSRPLTIENSLKSRPIGATPPMFWGLSIPQAPRAGQLYRGILIFRFGSRFGGLSSAMPSRSSLPAR